MRPSEFPALPLKYLMRPISAGIVLIKGHLDDLAEDEGFPAYSASGQDVRLPEPQFNGKGLVLSAVGAQCGKCFYASGQWGVVANTQAFLPTERGDARYLFYLVNQRDFWEVGGTAQPYVQVPRSMSQAVPAPPLNIQRRIARFLDEKTARIDGLIEKKRALLDRLAEKRQALITRAVTKGLTPNTPMKPSGIYWLGEIPAHWDILPLKHVVRYQEGPGIMAVDFRDEGVPLLRIASIGSRYATLDGVNYLDPEMVLGKWSHFLTEIGNLLISASATSGIVSEITEETSGCIPYTGIIRINPVDGMATPDFVRHWLVSNVFLSQIDQLKAGSTIQHFGPYHLGLMVITKPPLCEQRAIGLELDQTLGNLEQNEARVSLSIQLLSEYRSAVVTAALTGQLLELG